MKYYFALRCVFKGTVKDGDMSTDSSTQGQDAKNRGRSPENGDHSSPNTAYNSEQ